LLFFDSSSGEVDVLLPVMRLLRGGASLVVLFLIGCSWLPSGATIDYAAARNVSDTFMADLVANKVNEAVGLMEPDFIQTFGRAQAEAAVPKLFDYCGRPLDSEFKHDETGFKIYLDGHPMRKFYYAATTDRYPKGTCFFSVSVVPDKTGLKVTEYGPLKLLSGQLPAWLK
jgi:hypothetical protein